ncbi:hypothetical protein BGX34_005862 [Mortierella sp. NVP85]|nr:hypothetical protein BGX34_005862 [Mortierella sp. NVP85]
MLTVLHTLANSAGLFAKNAPATKEANPSHTINKALQNLHVVRKIILTLNLEDHQEQAALARLDQLLDQLSVSSLASLSYDHLQELADALVLSSTSSSTDLTHILTKIRSTTTTSTTTIVKKTTIIRRTASGDDDNVSVTSSEGPSSAVTVVDDDHVSLSVRSFLSLGIQNEAAGFQLTSGSLAVEHVAYSLSDLVFVYPSTASQSYLGHAAEQWSKAGLANATGASLAPQVLRMSTRSNAASAILGAVTSQEAKNSALSTLASSAAIVNMVPNLYQIAQSNTPVVFHVAAESVDTDLNIHRGDYSDVLVARETGLLYLASNSVQEAYDISILAHAVASSTNQSVIHVLDGVQTTQQVEAIKTVKDQDVAAFIKNEHKKSAPSQDEDSIVSNIEAIFERAATLLGRRYKAFEYSGPQDAETVVVVFGPAHSVAKNLGEKVGVLNIRLYRPWSFSHFLKAIPTTTKKVVVVEPVASTATHGPIFLDVSASFNLWTGKRPSVVDAKYGLHGSSLSQGWLKALVRQAVGSQGKLDLASIVADAEQPQEGVRQAIFWETVASAPVSAHVAKHFQSALGYHIQHSSRVNSYRHNAVIETRLQFTKSQTADLTHSVLADYALVQDASVLAEYNILASLKEGAVLVLNTSWTADELETKTSNAFRSELAVKQIRVLLIDFANISKELGLSGAGKTLLGQIAFLKTHSSNLREAAFDAIERQYETSNAALFKDLVLTLVEKVDKDVIEVPQNPNWPSIVLGEADQPALALPKHVRPTVRTTSNAFDGSLVNRRANADVAEESEAVALGKTWNWHKAAWQLLFSEAYSTRHTLADEGHSYLVSITENRRLTPSTYDRNVFHLEFDTTGTGLRYEIGDALGIHGWNDTQEVLDFIEFYGEKPDTIVVVPRAVPKNAPEGTLPRDQTNTLFQILQQTSDLFGRPSKRFYADLIPFATNAAEKERLAYLISQEGAAEFKERVDETVTHADVLREFPSAHPSIPQLINILPPIKPRHYSIASSQKAHPNSVHLLIVAVEWTAPSGKARFGQCTRYLTGLGVGTKVTVSIKPSVMKLPPSPHQPVIMAGLGTGMAPFRAFIQERAWQKAQGIDVGPMVLYFGSRNRSNEYLYGEELEAYHADGLLTHLRLAFSRDQREKIYIQHKMAEDGKVLHKYMLDSQLNGHFYLCGPTWPAGDVKDAIVQSFMDGEQCASVDANRIVNKLKEEERYVLEVY